MGFLTDLFQGATKTLTGGLIDFGADYLSNEAMARNNMRLQQKLNEESAQKAFDRSYGAYKTRYQDTMSDMRQAGLNPILAASSGFTVGSSPQSQTASIGQPTIYDQTPSQSGKNVAEQSLISEQKEKTKIEKTEAWERATKLRVDAMHGLQKIQESKAMQGKLKADERMVIKQIRVQMAEYWKRVVETKNLIQKGYQLYDQRQITKVELKKAKANLGLLGLQAQKLKSELNKLMQRSGFYKGVGGKALTSVELTLEALGKALGVIVPVGKFK